MPTSIAKDEVIISKVENVTFSATHFTFHLEDDRNLTVPLWWYPRLQSGTKKQRETFDILPGGVGVHWEELDEDISVRGLLIGKPAPGAIAPQVTAAE